MLLHRTLLTFLFSTFFSYLVSRHLATAGICGTLSYLLSNILMLYLCTRNGLYFISVTLTNRTFATSKQLRYGSFIRHHHVLHGHFYKRQCCYRVGYINYKVIALLLFIRRTRRYTADTIERILHSIKARKLTKRNQKRPTRSYISKNVA